jgi:hypothetical protein
MDYCGLLKMFGAFPCMNRADLAGCGLVSAAEARAAANPVSSYTVFKLAAFI